MVEYFNDQEEKSVVKTCQLHGLPSDCYIQSQGMYLCEECAKEYFNRPKQPLIKPAEV